ncbi:MAG: NAD(P)/FAD-dependent oxidoreductase [bacterium]
MSAWDALIVGGGPGGSTAALRLARSGLRVLLLDAAVFPRVKLCAGWVTKQAMADLELDPETYPHTIQPFEAVYVGLGKSLHETRWREPASYGIVRKEFDAFLLRRAEAAGAEVREGVRVRGVEAGAGGVRLDLGGEFAEGPLVVGAGGHACPVARALGGVSGEESVVLTQESETRVGSERLRAIAPNYGFPELFAEPDFNGYSWYFTKGEFLNIGVGCIGKRPSVHERRDAFLDRLRESDRLPADLELVPFKGHA